MTTTDIASSLTSALGINTGINTTDLVSSLVSATYDPKTQAVNTQISTNTARISALASAKSSLDTFSGALTDLLKTSDYSGQPVSNDPTIVAVSAMTDGDPAGLPAQIEVKQLASAQVLQSAALSAASDIAGTGTLTLTTGGNSFDITLTDPADTLNDLVSTINQSGAGITASVVTDNSGARLVLKGATGADQAFTLTAGTGADANLQRFTFDGTSGSLTQSQTAQNAKIAIDNVDMEFSTNEVTTAIPHLRIDLNKAQPGTTVTLATNQPENSMSQLVQDFVSAYNTLKTSLNGATASTTDASQAGLLSGDSGIRSMSQRLSELVTMTLSSDGTYRTLSDLGVRTERDGTLSVDTDTLNAAIAADPAAVTQMLNPTTPDANHLGIAGALKSVTDYLNGDSGPLASSTATYNALKTSLQAQLDKLDTDKSNYSDQLTTTYTTMQTRLLQFQATQSYLKQQIAAWNGTSTTGA